MLFRRKRPKNGTDNNEVAFSCNETSFLSPTSRLWEFADILSAFYVQVRALQHTIYRQSCAGTGNFYGSAFKVALMACTQVDGIST